MKRLLTQEGILTTLLYTHGILSQTLYFESLSSAQIKWRHIEDGCLETES